VGPVEARATREAARISARRNAIKFLLSYTRRVPANVDEESFLLRAFSVTSIEKLGFLFSMFSVQHVGAK
jgi:hypothetical protein